MDRCNELCTKEVAGYCGYCALCNVLAERDRFIRVWLKGGLFLDCYDWLIARLQDQSKAPGRWLYSVPRTEVRHKDVVREAHKQYSEALNKTMLTLLGVAFFCMLITLGSPDQLLLAAESKIKVPFTDASLPFVGFLVVAALLLAVLFIYLHVLYGYWLDCERERRSINERLIWTPPIESIPMLFSFPDAVSRLFTFAIFYMLVPMVVYVIREKARALPEVGLLLTYVAGPCFVAFFLLGIRRMPEPLHPPQPLVTLGQYVLPALWVVYFIVIPTLNPEGFQRPFNLFRTDLTKAWLPRTNMRNASAVLANFQEANLVLANLQGADLRGANLQGADLRGDPLNETKLMGAKNFTQEQVNTACVNEHTQLPEGLIRPAPCPAKP